MENRRAESVIKILADREIRDMKDYLVLLESGGVPMDARVSIWFYALARSWYRLPQCSEKMWYTVFLPCSENLPCLRCFADRIEKEQHPEKEDKKEPEEEERSERPGAVKTKPGEEVEQRPQGKSTEVLTGAEIKTVVELLDDDFKRLSIARLDRERIYLIQVILAAVQLTPDYQMLTTNKVANPHHVAIVLGIITAVITYSRCSGPHDMFRVVFLICSNINGFFFTNESTGVTGEQFSKFLLFIQNIATISSKKFNFLLDLMCMLDQARFAKLIRGIIERKIGVSSLNAELIKAYAPPKTEHPGVKRLFVATPLIKPKLMFLHTAEKKSVEEIKEENKRLRENVDTMANDIKFFNTCNLIADLRGTIQSYESEKKGSAEN